MNADLALILPELILTVGGLLTLCVGIFTRSRPAAGKQSVAYQVVACQAVALLTLAAAIAATGFAMSEHLIAESRIAESHVTGFSGLLVADAFASYAKLLIYGASSVCLMIAPRFFGPAMREEYPVLLLFAALGLGIMVAAHDMMLLYVGLELSSLAAYVLASFLRSDARSSEAGLKYFVLGSLASGILLYGISLLYGFSGSTEFTVIASAFAGELNAGLLFGLVFVLAGLGFKISAVPFHMWTPDVYEGAPTPVTAFFVSAPKVAAMALLTRVTLSAMPSAMGAWQQIIIVMALASIIWGALGAIGQKNIKRLLAYSSINNGGFMLIGLAVGTQAGVEAILTYLTVYVVTALGAFLVIVQLRDRDGNRIEDIASLAGLFNRQPWLAAALIIFLLSFAGIPPLFGFWPKYLVFEAAIQADLTLLAVAGIVASVVGAFVYIAIIKTLCFDSPASDADHDTSGTPIVADGSIIERGLIAASASWLLVIGYLFIPPLGVLSAVAARGLF